MKLCIVFIGINKTYDKVFKKVWKWSLVNRGLPKFYVSVIEDMHAGTSIRIRSLYMEMKNFTVRLGVHHDSDFNLYL